MVYAFNTVYVATIRNGQLITKEPVKAVYSEKTDTWVNKRHGIDVEWLGEVSLIWGNDGDERMFSSPNLEDVFSWIKENT